MMRTHTEFDACFVIIADIKVNVSYVLDVPITNGECQVRLG